MTDITLDTLAAVAARQPRRDIGIKRRYAAERRFRLYGVAAISFGLVFLAIMLVSIVSQGLHRLLADHRSRCRSTFDEKIIDPDNKRGNRSQRAGRRQLSGSSPATRWPPSSASTSTTSRSSPS